jgi:peptide/nickel transport system ATP-binding protein
MGATSKVFGNPRHAYTKMLLGSVPQLHERWHDIAEVGRAARELERLDETATALVQVEDDHFVVASSA